LCVERRMMLMEAYRRSFLVADVQMRRVMESKVRSLFAGC